MKAVVNDTYGPPDRVLAMQEVDSPVPGDGDVLFRVHAAGVDPGVWHLTAGRPYIVRLAGFGVLRPKEPVRSDVAGVVEAVGAAVTEFRPGDEVFGVCPAGFAEYAVTTPDSLARKPRRLTFEQAAALPTSGLAALQAVRDVARVKRGQRVLVIGAAGGVGTFAVQLAKAAGAFVSGVCSTAKVDHVRAIGADHVIDYTAEDFANGSYRYDVIIDTAGNRALSRLRRALTDEGTLVIVGGEGGSRLLGGTTRQLRALVLSPFSRQNLRTFISTTRHEDLLTLASMADAGQVTPVIDKRFALDEVPQAIKHLRDGRARGKVVVQVA
jgi:NADPH:quinone reductase-like Zn-dependent oxidoreductase